MNPDPADDRIAAVQGIGSRGSRRALERPHKDQKARNYAAGGMEKSDQIHKSTYHSPVFPF
jgi:hypothetical protein